MPRAESNLIVSAPDFYSLEMEISILQCIEVSAIFKAPIFCGPIIARSAQNVETFNTDK